MFAYASGLDAGLAPRGAWKSTRTGSLRGKPVARGLVVLHLFFVLRSLHVFCFLQAHLQLRRPQMGPRPHELAGARGESLCIVRRTFSDHSYELIGFLLDHV